MKCDYYSEYRNESKQLVSVCWRLKIRNVDSVLPCVICEFVKGVDDSED